MKKNIATICMSLMILILSTGMALAGNGKLGNKAGANGGGTGLNVESLPYDYPSDEEIAALTFMVEEEKVARDVYNVLYESTSIPAFANIAKAEQRHMDAIMALLDKYELNNPLSLEAGVFLNPDLQTLYNNLVALGQANEENALLVGATIEDVDIFDLLHELDVVDNEDITRVFENLLKGSENHLRAFNSLLVMYGYAPYAASEFLTQAEIDTILAATRIKGNSDGSVTPKEHLPRQDRMLDADGDGICDFLQ